LRYPNHIILNFKNKAAFNSTNFINYKTNYFFLKKEKCYTKLKYSRTPAYDIVSGGSAALFAAILGYLTTEKFGFELVDSGDFYFMFMYAVFLVFSVRPLLQVMPLNSEYSYVYSYTHVLKFYSNLINIFFFFTKKIY